MFSSLASSADSFGFLIRFAEILTHLSYEGNSECSPFTANLRPDHSTRNPATQHNPSTVEAKTSAAKG